MRTFRNFARALCVWLLCTLPVSGETRSPVEVRVGIYQNPPKIFVNEEGEPSGFFPEITEAIAESNNWELVWVESPWPALLESLEAGELDLLLDVAKTPERVEQMALNDNVVLSNWSTFYNRKEDPRLISIRDLQGQRIAVLEGSSQLAELQFELESLQLDTFMVPLSSFGAVLREVAEGRADVAVVNQLVGKWYGDDLRGLRENDIIFQPVALHVAASQEAAALLLPDFDTALEELKANPDSAYFLAMEKWILRKENGTLRFWAKVGPWILGIAVLVLVTLGLIRWQLMVRTRQLKEKIRETEELNRSLQEQQTSLRKYEFILEHIPYVVWTANPQAQLTFCNQHGLRLTGAKMDEMLQTGWEKYVHPDDLPVLWEKWKKAVENKAVFLNEERIYSIQEDQWRWHLMQATPMLNDSGEVTQWAGVATDIHQLRIHQDELIAAKDQADQANRAKSEFLAMMNHELRTPLNAIIGSSDLLIEDVCSGSRRDLVRIILNSGNHLMQLISDILELSRIEAGHFELDTITVDLRNLVQQCTTQLSDAVSSKGLELGVHVDERLPVRVLSDPKAILQILSNLVGNAVKFTSKGRVDVALEWTPSGENPDRGRLCIRVSDTGPGISAEAREWIFEPFRQQDMTSRRDFGGTGLGLAICSRLAEALCGNLQLKESSDKGSVFEFSAEMEVVRDSDSTDTIHRGSRQGQSSGKYSFSRIGRVLLVEDDPGNIRIFEMTLTRLGLKCDIAKTGEHAVQLAISNPYDVIFMDIWLPGMDGIEAARQIRQLVGKTAKSVIVAHTAHAMEENRLACLSAGIDKFLTKPTRMQDIVAVLEQVAENLPAN